MFQFMISVSIQLDVKLLSSLQSAERDYCRVGANILWQSFYCAICNDTSGDINQLMHSNRKKPPPLHLKYIFFYLILRGSECYGV